MTIKRRLARLESTLGGKSSKHFLWVRGAYSESKQAAIAPHLCERGIMIDDAGSIWLWGDAFYEDVDFKNYGRKEDLIG